MLAALRTQWDNNTRRRERTIWKVTENPTVGDRETHGSAMKTIKTRRSHEYWGSYTAHKYFWNSLDEIEDVRYAVLTARIYSFVCDPHMQTVIRSSHV